MSEINGKHPDPGSLEPIRVQFGKDHFIVEPSEAAASRWETARTAAARYDAETGKLVEVLDPVKLAELRSTLVGPCLFKNGEAEPLGSQAAAALPRRVFQAAYEVVHDLYLKAHDGESAKN